MSRLSREARETIKNYCDVRAGWLTIAGYTRWRWPDGIWRGDRCGCTDDRCIGYHHDDEDDECGCLPVLLDLYAQTLLQTP